MENVIDELRGLYHPKVEERIREIAKQIPEICDLAVKISKIPKDYAEKNKKYSLTIRNLFIEKLRENTNLFLKGKINSGQISFYVIKTLKRVNSIIDKNNKKNLKDAVLHDSSLSPEDKAEILKIIYR